MPVITVASPKGGTGKSTAAVLLGTEIARGGAEVVLLDCDPNRSLSMWAARGRMPARVRVLADVGEAAIIRMIQDHDRDGTVVVVDLEGVASRLVSRAISQADLVLTPMRATSLDATIGARAVRLVAEEEEVVGRRIRHAVVFTMTRAVRSRAHRGIERSLRGQGVDVIQPPLMERAAFADLFGRGGDLYGIPDEGTVATARANARGAGSPPRSSRD